MTHSEEETLKHGHSFNVKKQKTENRTLIVVIFTLVMMVAEILFGMWTNSMALLADGWHMGTHAFALGISLVAYILARKNAENDKFSFGTWKIEILGAFTSAIVLGIVAFLMVYSSVERLFHPLTIHCNEAILVAVIGLVVNIISALILNHGHTHGADHTDEKMTKEELVHHKHGVHDDLNLKSAYMHVIADALTSVLALIALTCAKYYSLNWLDPLMGIVGAVLISRWSFTLIKDSGLILLDFEKNSALSEKIRKEIEYDGMSRITDLHLWRVAENKYACIIAILTNERHAADYYRKIIANNSELAHITIEINGM